MLIKEIFKKELERTIEGVIKADDDRLYKTELEEFVITKEIEQRLETFLGLYNNYQNVNGAWISGFYGAANLIY